MHTSKPKPRAFRFPTKQVGVMSRAELQRWQALAATESSRTIDLLIQAGRGNERLNDVRTQSDALSQHQTKVIDLESDLSYEVARRLRYHGKLTPIPVATPV